MITKLTEVIALFDTDFQRFWCKFSQWIERDANFLFNLLIQGGILSPTGLSELSLIKKTSAKMVGLFTIDF